METKTCPCGHKEEDYESLFTHIEIEAYDEFSSRGLAQRQVSIAAPTSPNQLPATDIAKKLWQSPSSSLAIPSNEQSFIPAPQSSRIFPPSLPSTSPSSPLSHATDRRMAHCEPPKEKNLVTTRVVRPDGSRDLTDWSNDAEVQSLVEDLNNTGWILIKGRALQWKPVPTKQSTDFGVTGASFALILPMLKLS